jgi:hypothetical protein
MPELTLLERFAKQQGVAPDVARKQLFAATIPGWRRPFMRLFGLILTDAFRLDRSFVEDAGRSHSLREVEHAVEIFRYRSQGEKSWVRNQLGFRASGRRVVDLAAKLFARPAGNSPDSVAR